jgi:lipoprotein-anchoring transpeptidase ErfK/SrfK
MRDASWEGPMITRRVGIASFLLFCFVFVFVPSVYADTTYVVKPGDNLFRIALNHGLTTQELASANGITNLSRVYAGQVLRIPSPGSTTVASPAPTTRTVPTTSSTYTVKQGETLYRIAVNHGVSVQALAQANGILNPSHIYTGQRLTIPGANQVAAVTENTKPPQVTVPSGTRWIDINLSTQRLTAFEGNTPVYGASVSTGIRAYPTVVGQFKIYTRYASQTMDGRRLGFDYYLPGVPYVMYFYGNYAIHGTYWHSNFGTPMSHGCVNMSTPDAQWLYNWSSIGTPVNVHY